MIMLLLMLALTVPIGLRMRVIKMAPDKKERHCFRKEGRSATEATLLRMDA